jgi:lipopolysaccharide heptosyltransferase I
MTPAPPAAAPGRVLIVRVSAVGDVVHTLPAAAALAEAGWEVDWLVEPLARPLLEGNPVVSKVIAAPRARRPSLAAARTALRDMRARRHDVALDLQGLWKSALWARLSGARRVLGLAAGARREPASAVLLRERVDGLPEGGHVIDRNLAALRALGIDAVGRRTFPLPPTAEAGARVASRLVAGGVDQFALLSPGGGWASKLWPVTSWGALSRHVRGRGLVPLVAWGPGEEGLADAVVAASGGAAVRAFPTTLLELAELARRARLVVAADTGPLHLAAAVGAPLVGIFGPTDPARNGPFAAADVTVRRTPLCAPCHRRRCDRHEGVMDAITPQQVAAALDQRLAALRSEVAV